MGKERPSWSVLLFRRVNIRESDVCMERSESLGWMEGLYLEEVGANSEQRRKP